MNEIAVLCPAGPAGLDDCRGRRAEEQITEEHRVMSGGAQSFVQRTSAAPV